MKHYFILCIQIQCSVVGAQKYQFCCPLTISFYCQSSAVLYSPNGKIGSDHFLSMDTFWQYLETFSFLFDNSECWCACCKDTKFEFSLTIFIKCCWNIYTAFKDPNKTFLSPKMKFLVNNNIIKRCCQTVYNLSILVLLISLIYHRMPASRSASLGNCPKYEIQVQYVLPHHITGHLHSQSLIVRGKWYFLVD